MDRARIILLNDPEAAASMSATKQELYRLMREKLDGTAHAIV